MWRDVLLPFVGTCLGALCAVFPGKRPAAPSLPLSCLAAGVMAAAAVWSLLLPAQEQLGPLGRFAFLPLTGGFWLGVLFLAAAGRLISRLYAAAGADKNGRSRRSSVMLMLSVTVHNIPEGLAVGAAWAVVKAGMLRSEAAATALAIGIAIQNIPEGAIISLPLGAVGIKRGRAVLMGVLSGAVEPLAALLMIGLAERLAPLIPYLLSFAAGAMVYVIVEELIPETASRGRAEAGALGFSIGFTLMMALDIALG